MAFLQKNVKVILFFALYYLYPLIIIFWKIPKFFLET